MAHIDVFIAVRHGRAFVSRHIAERDGSFSWESAVNESEIEHDAIEAVKTQGGDLTRDGRYDCPPALAARAQWPSNRADSTTVA
jgi:hypothetical protein